MARHGATLVLLLLLVTLNAFTVSSAFSLATPALTRQSTTASAGRSCLLHQSSVSDDAPLESEQPAESSSSVPDPIPTPPRVVSRNRSSLDPLVASLTRMDEETLQAKRTNIPIWGELILDKSLMIFIPVTLFAVIGLGMSFYVALNSQDAIVDALFMDTTTAGGAPEYLRGVAEPVTDGSCRGLCGSQQENLESLRGFMSGLSGAK